MLKSRKLGELVEKWGGGDDQLFMGAKQTPVMNAKLRIDSGQGYNDYRFGLAHATGRDRLIFVDEAFRYSRHGMGTEAPWIELDGDCARTGGNLAAVLLHLRENHFKRYDLIALLSLISTMKVPPRCGDWMQQTNRSGGDARRVPGL